jgi:hypothetical protein
MGGRRKKREVIQIQIQIFVTKSDKNIFLTLNCVGQSKFVIFFKRILVDRCFATQNKLSK